ncbi:MAG: WXG100 family type VII secretion target, partial [Propionibacteriaceae bacterium]|nr:WXG100 family type VII secretion target [Propionibacteriaceae bacterium]
MANVNVTYDEMRQAATTLESGESDINSELTRLQSYIQNLVSSGFVTDAASVSFNDAYNQ